MSNLIISEEDNSFNENQIDEIIETSNKDDFDKFPYKSTLHEINNICDESKLNKKMTVPAKRNTKTYDKDKIKLMGETQRIIRDFSSPIIKYKPKSYKTITEFKIAMELSLEKERQQKRVIHNKENVKDKLSTDSTGNQTSDDPLPLRERVKMYNEIKHNPQPKSIDFKLEVENMLRKKYQNGCGYIELKTKEQYAKDKIKSEIIMNNLKKSMNHVPVIEDKSFTDLSTIIKTIDPETGNEILEEKLISVRKHQSLNLLKCPKGIDPYVANQVQSRLTDDALIKWKMMTAHEKNLFQRKLLLKDADAKRRLLRESRIKDMPVITKVEIKEKKNNNDDLSDDDFEWTGANEENDSKDSDSESTSSETEDNEEDDDEDFDLKNKRGKHIRVGIIDDEEEIDKDDDTVDVLQFINIQSFVDDTVVIDTSKNEISELSFEVERTAGEDCEVSSEIIQHESSTSNVKESTILMKDTESSEETAIFHLDESSNSTILLNSEDNSIYESTSNSVSLNNFHSKLFQFSNNKIDQLTKDSSKTVQEVFSNLSSLMKDGENNVGGTVDINLKDSDVDDIDLKNSDVEDIDEDDIDLDDSDSDGVDLDKSCKAYSNKSYGGVDLDASDCDEANSDVSSNSESADSDTEMKDEEAQLDCDDEEEVLRKHVNSGHKFVPTDYIDEEAALSGSDAEEFGSDEDERDLDIYEDEEGDKDKLPSEGQLRRQIERIHHKLEVDKDAHDIRYIKEMYLEDGDLNVGADGPRKKRFNWDDMNYDNDFMRTSTSDGENEKDYEDLEESNVQSVDNVDNLEDEGMLLMKYEKFMVNKRLSIQKNEGVVRPAWSTNTTGTSAITLQPAVKKFGSMMNKTISSLHLIKTDSVKTSLNDLDLKTRMSVMFTTSSRPSNVNLKRETSTLPKTSPKKQRTDSYKK